jgi:hypothetical protein
MMDKLTEEQKEVIRLYEDRVDERYKVAFLSGFSRLPKEKEIYIGLPEFLTYDDCFYIHEDNSISWYGTDGASGMPETHGEFKNPEEFYLALRKELIILDDDKVKLRSPKKFLSIDALLENIEDDGSEE